MYASLLSEAWDNIQLLSQLFTPACRMRKSVAFLRVTRKEREGLDQRSSTSKPSKSMFALFAQGNTRRRIDAQVRERRWWRRGRSGLGECGLLY